MCEPANLQSPTEPPTPHDGSFSKIGLLCERTYDVIAGGIQPYRQKSFTFTTLSFGTDILQRPRLQSICERICELEEYTQLPLSARGLDHQTPLGSPVIQVVMDEQYYGHVMG